MKTLEEFLDMVKNKIENAPEEKQKDLQTMYDNWVELYDTAEQLCYGKVVLQKILNARNLVHAENILIDARRHCDV